MIPECAAHRPPCPDHDADRQLGGAVDCAPVEEGAPCSRQAAHPVTAAYDGMRAAHSTTRCCVSDAVDVARDVEAEPGAGPSPGPAPGPA